MTATISATQVKELRERTGSGLMECKNALSETSGDVEKAIDILRKKGSAKAAKKASRETREGIIGSYIHATGKIGVMVEICCETDFVAKNEKFRAFSKDVAMHIAAANPAYLKREDVPQEIIEREKEIFREGIGNKPENIQEKILEGKLNKFYSEICLLEQRFVKDDDVTIGELLTVKITELGENLVLRRYTRFELGN